MGYAAEYMFKMLPRNSRGRVNSRLARDDSRGSSLGRGLPRTTEQVRAFS
jgi:hypothetical protein